jgi:hypothetical protein
MKDIGRDWGVAISEGLAETIAKTAKDMPIEDRYTATLLNLKKIIDEVGGIEAFGGVDKAAAKTRDIFVSLSRGLITTRQAARALDEVFPDLAKAATNANGVVADSVRELIRLEQDVQTGSAAIADFIKAQLGEGLKGFAGWGQAYTDTTKSAADARKALAEAEKKLAEATTSTEREELAKRVAELRKSVSESEALARAMAVQTEQDAQAAAGAILGTIQGLVAQGVPMQQAITQALPAINALREQMQAAGIGGTEAFDKLNTLALTATDTMVAQALPGVQGLTQGLLALYTTGLTEQEFTSLTGRIGATYQALIDQGKDAPAVLALMQPQLQTM